MHKIAIILFTAICCIDTAAMQTNSLTTTPESSVDFNYKQCITLEQIALQLDAIYAHTQQLIDVNKAEAAYIKAIKCFLEEYQKKSTLDEALIKVTKMWVLLLQIEQEKKSLDTNYIMPETIRELATKINLLSIKPPKNNERITLKTLDNKKPTLADVAQLKLELDRVIAMHNNDQQDETIPEQKPALGILYFRQGSFLYNQAKKTLVSTQTLPSNPEDYFNNLENSYIEALKFFIEAYDQRYNSFTDLHKTVKNILDIELIRKTIECNYAINPDYLKLQEALLRITEQEKKRRNNT